MRATTEQINNLRGAYWAAQKARRESDQLANVYNTMLADLNAEFLIADGNGVDVWGDGDIKPNAQLKQPPPCKE